MKLISRKPADAGLERMRPLAKLPVFFDLAGKRVVVAGGAAPAAWKAELLAAAGAHIEIFSTEPGPEMLALIERGAAAGQILHIERAWAATDLDGAAMALADAEDDIEAGAFFAAARAAGVPVNVIDKPAFCEFQFGSIVNRSPVIVSISTDGASPILGQAIRRRIETLLPQSLSQWAQLAKSLRGIVASRLIAGRERRLFWERFADLSFGDAPSSNAREHLLNDIGDIARGSGQSGRVSLVGAGPGDAELLTLKAVRAMQSADVILFDDLVSNEVLELARREAKRIAVGKRGGRGSCAQSDINELMTTLARQGKHVVRLKCGDPMIFGRAGEEIEQLEHAGIDYTVIPGITAASAMAAAFGLSLTHRNHAQSVRFVTGHASSGELPDNLDWAGLACPRTTLIVYMGGRTATMLARRLIDSGLDETTPVIASSAVSSPHAKHWRANLAKLARGGLPETMKYPVLIGIGTAFLRLEPRQSTDDCYSASVTPPHLGKAAWNNSDAFNPYGTPLSA